MNKVTATEYRVGRNFVRLGDTVKVTPRKSGGRDGFDAVVREIVLNCETTEPTADDVKEVTVISERNKAWRTLYPNRIKRRSQAAVARKGTR